MNAKGIIYKLEVWQTLDGIRAILPQEVQGPILAISCLAQLHYFYALGMTQLALFEFLRGFGIEIFERQVYNILMNKSASYERVSEDILKRLFLIFSLSFFSLKLYLPYSEISGAIKKVAHKHTLL